MALNGDHYEVYGVVSYGSGCADPDYPGIYGDIWQVKNWIVSTMGHDGCS